MFSIHLVSEATTQALPGLELWGPAALLLLALGFVGRWLMQRYDRIVDRVINEVIPLLTQVVQAVRDLLDALGLAQQVNRLRTERAEFRDRAVRAEALVETMRAQNEALQDQLRRR